MTPMVTLLKPNSLTDQRRGVGQAHAIQVGDQVHQAEEQQHHPAHMTSPGFVRLLHFLTSVTPRKIKPELLFVLNAVVQIYTAPCFAAIFFRKLWVPISAASALSVPKNAGRRGLYKTVHRAGGTRFCRGRPHLGRAAFRIVCNSNLCISSSTSTRDS